MSLFFPIIRFKTTNRRIPGTYTQKNKEVASQLEMLDKQENLEHFEKFLKTHVG